MKRFLSKILLVLSIMPFSMPAHADPMKEFLTTCAYGTIGGALVGAASLAFTDKPDGSLNNIARGASIGLYTGILFGIYIAYYVESPKSGPKASDIGSLQMSPVFSDSLAFDGARVDYTFMRF